MLHDDGDKRIVNAVIQLSKGFGMEVTAEGVEDEPTARALARMGCDRLQGFHFARPMPQEALLGWLAERERSSDPSSLSFFRSQNTAPMPTRDKIARIMRMVMGKPSAYT